MNNTDQIQTEAPALLESDKPSEALTRLGKLAHRCAAIETIMGGYMWWRDLSTVDLPLAAQLVSKVVRPGTFDAAVGFQYQIKQLRFLVNESLRGDGALRIALVEKLPTAVRYTCPLPLTLQFPDEDARSRFLAGYPLPDDEALTPDDLKHFNVVVG